MAKRFNNDESGVITAKVCSDANGLQQFDNVAFIRIKSKKYTLLIMRDYMPVVGEVEGDVYISCGGEEITFTDVNGYFMHKRNEFSLMLKEEGEEEYAE